MDPQQNNDNPNNNEEDLQNPDQIAESSNPNPQTFEVEDLFGSINNNIFLSENTLETLYTILFSKGSYLDEITLKDGKLDERFSGILRNRHNSLLNFLGDKMQFYHSKVIDGELSHLEKLMKILRSKKREMRLKRIENTDENLKEEEKNEENNNNNEENINKNEENMKNYEENMEKNEENINNKEKIDAKKENPKNNEEENNNNEEIPHNNKQEIPQNNEENINIIPEILHNPEENITNNSEILNSETFNKHSQTIPPSEEISKERTRSKSFSFASLPKLQRISSCINMTTPPPPKRNHNNIFSNDLHNLLNFSDLSELSSMNIFKKKMMREYNPADNSFSFKLNNRYLVTLKSCDEKLSDKTSLFHRIPYSVMQNYIFPCFSAYGLFYLRQVSGEWRELIRSMWHKTFQREMHEQLYAADLCQEIECNFRLIALRTPFVHKFAIFLKALAEILDWNWVAKVANSKNEDVDKRIKMIFYGIYKILGNKTIQEISNINDVSDEIWDEIKPGLLENSSLKTDMNNVIDSEYYFDSNVEIIKMREKLINSYVISMSSLNDLEEDKNNVIILNIYLKQLFLFALLKNSVFIGQKFLYHVKNVLKKISDSWPQKKGFLEGAYKILLFKNIKFVNGQIIVTEEEDFEGGELEDEGEDTKNSFFNLMNNFRDPSVPDFLIKKRGNETRIYLDDATKSELILSSILSFSTRSLGKLMNLASKTKEKIERINEEIKKEQFLKQEREKLMEEVKERLEFEEKNGKELLEEKEKDLIEKDEKELIEKEEKDLIKKNEKELDEKEVKYLPEEK